MMIQFIVHVLISIMTVFLGVIGYYLSGYEFVRGPELGHLYSVVVAMAGFFNVVFAFLWRDL